MYFSLISFASDNDSFTCRCLALAFYTPASFEHVYYSALKYLKKGKADSALFNLHQLIKGDNLTQHQIALTTSTIGGILISQGKENEAKAYLVQAAIADIKSSTKETLALLALARAEIQIKKTGEGKSHEAFVLISCFEFTVCWNELVKLL